MRNVIIGTAGHIDHGKTSLVRRLTGIDTDRLPEEKARGISIDLGFAHFETDDFRFGVVDVPGHERFVKNMVAGATGVDLALLVVAADDSVMPQTIEHLEIMDLLGVVTGLVAITKIDLVEPGFVDLVKAEVAERTRGTFLEGCPIVPLSSQTGAGFDELRAALVDVARRREWPERGELFRMAIDRVFTVEGHGSVVTGTVLGGEVHPGDTLELVPQQQPLRVRGVQSHGQQVDESGARTRTAINLAGVRTDELHRGQELAAPGWLQPSRRLLISVRCLSSSPIELKDRTRLNLHLGTGEVAARLVLKGQTLAPGSRGYAELRLAEPVVATFGQRYILRRPSPPLTIAGGMILDPSFAPARKITDLQTFGAALESADELGRLSMLLAERDEIDASPLPISAKAGMAPSRYAELLARLKEQGSLVRLGGKEAGRLIHRERLAGLCSAVMKRIRAELEQHQPRRSLPRAVIVNACRRLAPAELLDAAFDELLRRRELAAVGPNFGPADAQVQLSKNQQALRTKILEQIEAGGLTPPNLKELAAALAQKPETILSLITVCLEDGLLVDVGDSLYYPPAAIDRAREIGAATLSQKGAATMSELREAWGVTRKYSVPLCEFFDARKITIRDGDLRKPGPNAGQTFVP